MVFPQHNDPSFTILTRDKFGEIRKYGGDKFKVLVERVVPQAEIEAEAQEGEEENEDDNDDDDSDSESEDEEEEEENGKGAEEEVELTQRNTCHNRR